MILDNRYKYNFEHASGRKPCTNSHVKFIANTLQISVCSYVRYLYYKCVVQWSFQCVNIPSLPVCIIHNVPEYINYNVYFDQWSMSGSYVVSIVPW